MNLETTTLRPAESNREDFAELARTVRERGLLSRRRGYYQWKIGTTIGALVALAGIALVIGNSWWNLLVAVGLAFILVQLGFIGHDAGHRQICAQRRGNHAVGLVVTNLLTGFSFSWWLAKHNRHHAHPNRPDQDPDMAPGALAYTRDQVAARGSFGRLYASAQAFLLVPLLFLEALNLHAASVKSLIGRRDRAAIVESALLAGHVFFFVVVPFIVLSPVRAVVFIAVTQLLFGFYLGVSFLTNHVGMPALVGGTTWVSCVARCLPRATCPVRSSPGSSSVGWIPRSSTTCSRPCLEPTFAVPGSSSARSAPSTGSPTPSRAPGRPTVRYCGICKPPVRDGPSSASIDAGFGVWSSKRTGASKAARRAARRNVASMAGPTRRMHDEVGDGPPGVPPERGGGVEDQVAVHVDGE